MKTVKVWIYDEGCDYHSPNQSGSVLEITATEDKNVRIEVRSFQREREFDGSYLLGTTPVNDGRLIVNKNIAKVISIVLSEILEENNEST